MVSEPDEFKQHGLQKPIAYSAPVGLTHQPTKLWVFLDEHPDTMLGTCMEPSLDAWDALANGWWQLPASYHNKACGFGFADGHVEMHKWLVAATCPPINMTTNFSFQMPKPSYNPNQPQDMAWMLARTTWWPDGTDPQGPGME